MCKKKRRPQNTRMKGGEGGGGLKRKEKEKEKKQLAKNGNR